MTLTEKQTRFVDFYIETGNATESARRAGYKGNNLNRVASENLSKLDIKNLINERMAIKERDRIADHDEVLKFHTSVMRGEITEKIPFIINGAIEMIDKPPSIKDRQRSADYLGKIYGATGEEKDKGNLNQLVEAINTSAKFLRGE